MPGKEAKIQVTELQHALLEEIVASRTESVRLVQRAKIILLAFTKHNNEEIGKIVGLNPQQVSVWRKPFFRNSRNCWYVQLKGKQINLGPDKEEAFRQYYQMMADAASGNPTVPRADDNHLIAALCDHFLEWVQRNRSADTYEWYRYRLQRFIDHYPDLTASKLRPFRHVHQLQRRVLAGILLAVLGELSDRAIERLDRIGGVRRPSDFLREVEYRNEVPPFAPPLL